MRPRPATYIAVHLTGGIPLVVGTPYSRAKAEEVMRGDENGDIRIKSIDEGTITEDPRNPHSPPLFRLVNEEFWLNKKDVIFHSFRDVVDPPKVIGVEGGIVDISGRSVH